MSRYSISGTDQVKAPPSGFGRQAQGQNRDRRRVQQVSRVKRGSGGGGIFALVLLVGTLAISASVGGLLLYFSDSEGGEAPSLRPGTPVAGGQSNLDREKVVSRFEEKENKGGKIDYDPKAEFEGGRGSTDLIDGGNRRRQAPRRAPVSSGFQANRSVASIAFSTGDYSTAFRHFEDLASKGDPAAQASLGQMFLEGLGIEKDVERALELFEASAQRGEPAGMNGLGWLHLHGLGVEQNPETAASWYRRSAEKGDGDGQTLMGWLFQNGLGVEANDREAVAWYRRSAEQGNPAGEAKLGWMFLNGRGVATDLASALLWSQRAAEKGDPSGANQLGWLFERGGGGLASDAESAVQWYRKAAEGGHPSAMDNLARLYQNGIGVVQDLAKAEFWREKRAALDGPDTYSRLAADG